MRRLQVDQAVGIAIRKNLGPALSDTCQISSDTDCQTLSDSFENWCQTKHR